MFSRIARGLAALALIAVSAWGQTSSGSISGRVLDPSGQAVPGATLRLVRQDTGETRTFTSDAVGEFTFTSVQPGSYDLSAKADGFKQFDKRGLSLAASERLSAGDLRLQVGSVSEAIEVTADPAPVQIVSSERSSGLDAAQVTNFPSRGRDVMALLGTLPGVVMDGEGSDSFGVANSPSSISGTRGVYSAMNIDGVSGNSRSGDHHDSPTNMDTIAEVRVLSNTYQAEFGKGAGGIINVITKSG
jgi:hypothetical protein